MPDAGWFVIWSIEHTAWWRPGEMGYTINLHEAGRYPRPRAEAIVAAANIASFEECMIPVFAIGAAPELLAALKDCCAALGGVIANPDAIPASALAAIAKAEGR